VQKLLKFLDYAGIDAKLYWRVLSPCEAREYEVQWRKDQTMPWRFRRVGDLFWQMCKTEDLAMAMEKFGLDIAKFERKLHHTILQQVAYADRIVSEGRSILGHEAVDYAIDENQRFLKQLEDVIVRMKEQKPIITTAAETNARPALRLISDHDQRSIEHGISSPAD
jgi:hypothetical protein